MEFWAQAVKLGSSDKHCPLGINYDNGGDSMKAKFHYKAAAMAGHKVARYNLGCMDCDLGNIKQAVKHCIISASARHYDAMNSLQIEFEQGNVSRDVMTQLGQHTILLVPR